MIALALEISKVTSHFDVYRAVRVVALKAELRDLDAGGPGTREWTLTQTGPYEKGSHPFRRYFLLAYNLLRAELQLWGSTLPSNEESLQAFVSVCEEIVTELRKAVAPLLLERKPVTGNSSNQNAVIRQVPRIRLRSSVRGTRCNLAFVCRLFCFWCDWIFWTFLPATSKSSGQLMELFVHRVFAANEANKLLCRSDLCRPDVRHESGASTSLMMMRDAVVQAALHSMDFLLSVRRDGRRAGDQSSVALFSYVITRRRRWMTGMWWARRRAVVEVVAQKSLPPVTCTR